MKDDFVKEITNIDDDFARWYTDIVIKNIQMNCLKKQV